MIFLELRASMTREPCEMKLKINRRLVVFTYTCCKIQSFLGVFMAHGIDNNYNYSIFKCIATAVVTREMDSVNLMPLFVQYITYVARNSCVSFFWVLKPYPMILMMLMMQIHIVYFQLEQEKIVNNSSFPFRFDLRKLLF